MTQFSQTVSPENAQILVSVFSNLGLLEEAEKLFFGQVTKNSQELPVKLLAEMIKGYGTAWKPEKGQKLYQKLVQEGPSFRHIYP